LERKVRGLANGWMCGFRELDLDGRPDRSAEGGQLEEEDPAAVGRRRPLANQFRVSDCWRGRQGAA